MPTIKYASLLAVFLILIGIWSASGCKSKINYYGRKDSNIGDVFCDGQSVSVVFANDNKIMCHDPRPHGGSTYAVAITEDSWIINWSLSNEDEIGVPVVRHVERYELEIDRGNGKIVKQTGNEFGSILSYGSLESVVIRGEHLKVLENGIEKLPENTIRIDNDVIAPHGYIFTRTRNHVFSWYPKPAIYSLPDMKMVKEFKPTESFKEFTKHYKWRENLSVILTQDLSNLIAVPQNGSVDETMRGDQNTKAFCYQTERDDFSAISLTGLGDATIDDAEMVEGELHWLVRRGQGFSDDWVILDSRSQTIADFTLPLPPEHQRYFQFWDPKNNLIWIVKFAPQKGNISRAFSVIIHNIENGSREEIILPPFDESQLVIPK